MDVAEETFAKRGIKFSSIRGDQTPSARTKNIDVPGADRFIKHIEGNKFRIVRVHAAVLQAVDIRIRIRFRLLKQRF